jgi:hypothetical protein
MEESTWQEFIEPRSQDNQREFKSIEYPLSAKQWDLPKVPKDNEGFVESFTIQQEAQYLDFFDRFGFVVIRDVIPKEDVDASILEIWEELEGDKTYVEVNMALLRLSIGFSIAIL